MEEQKLHRTPLYDAHRALHGKMVPFAGWEMPVQYAGLIPEHTAVRTRAGLFDVSHMGEIVVRGPEAEQAISSLTCNDLSLLTDGKAQYNAIINPHGGVVDDIIVYRFSAQHFLICVNASNTAKDFAWFTSHNQHHATFENMSAEYGQIAFQGPLAREITFSLGGAARELQALKPFHFRELLLQQVPVIAARTGYTGEDGFEFFTPWAETLKLWNTLLDAGASRGVMPAGLGARDTLRLEACYPLHGHELDDSISAIESGLGWIVKPKKGEFIGRRVLEEQLASGSPRQLIGFYIEDAGIARHGDQVLDVAGNKIGTVTSGTKTPTVQRALGMALVESRCATVGTPLQIEVRGKPLHALVAKRPFYKRSA